MSKEEKFVRVLNISGELKVLCPRYETIRFAISCKGCSDYTGIDPVQSKIFCIRGE